MRHGITLLELAIVLAIVGVIVFIALPTLKPTEGEADIEFAKEMLSYLHGQEQRYFETHGKYAPLKLIAEDAVMGPDFDQRFATEQPEVNGIKFAGPSSEGGFYEIVATLPDGTRYSVSPTGEIRAVSMPVQ